MTSWSLTVRWIAPNSTPFSWLSSNPEARRATSKCACRGVGPSCFSAQSRMAPACGKRPGKKALARRPHR
eukprot:3599796-Alexandrium_andersonii.AAC.1